MRVSPSCALMKLDVPLPRSKGAERRPHWLVDESDRQFPAVALLMTKWSGPTTWGLR